MTAVLLPWLCLIAVFLVDDALVTYGERSRARRIEAAIKGGKLRRVP